MPTFVYRAADASGRTVKGRLEGESQAAVLRALEQQSLVPLNVRAAKARRLADEQRARCTNIGLSLREKLEFTRQLKVMLESGVTILSTLGVLRQCSKGPYRRLLEAVSTDIQRGAPLSEALAAHPRTFDAFYVGTVRAGETGGVHTEALQQLINYYERRAALRREVRSALTYPAIVIATLIGACCVMLVWVIPQFKGLFGSFGAELPWATRLLLGLSGFVASNAALLGVGAALLIGAGILAMRFPTGRAALASVLRHVPILGEIAHLAAVVQFARMLALLERAGLPLLETLRVVERMLPSGPVKRLAASMRTQVGAGSSLAAAVSGAGVLPDMLEHMISVGEEAGRIDETLFAAAGYLEEELRARIHGLTIALEPALTILVSAMVMFVALAIFLPLWDTPTLLLHS